MISKPFKKIPKFSSLIKIKIHTENEIDPKKLKKLKKLVNSSVTVFEKSRKRSEKIISNLNYKKTSNNSFNLIIKTEGGLPVKRFVESNEVNPGISKILNNSCSCNQFDFYEVLLE